MNDELNLETNIRKGDEKSQNKKPTHKLFVVENKKDGDGKGFWHQVGVAWTNKDGSWSIKLSALPVDGRLQMQPND